MILIFMVTSGEFTSAETKSFGEVREKFGIKPGMVEVMRKDTHIIIKLKSEYMKDREPDPRLEIVEFLQERLKKTNLTALKTGTSSINIIDNRYDKRHSTMNFIERLSHIDGQIVASGDEGGRFGNDLRMFTTPGIIPLLLGPRPEGGHLPASLIVSGVKGPDGAFHILKEALRTKAFLGLKIIDWKIWANSYSYRDLSRMIMGQGERVDTKYPSVSSKELKEILNSARKRTYKKRIMARLNFNFKKGKLLTREELIDDAYVPIYDKKAGI